MQIDHWVKGLIMGTVLTISSAPLAAQDAAITLVERGENRTAIILAADAPENLQVAAATLADSLARIGQSPTPVPVVDGPSATDLPVRLWVGHHPEITERLPRIDLTWQEPEAFLIGVYESGDIVLAGQDVVHDGGAHVSGSQQAVYTFLQDRLGVRWLWPGELGTDIPQQDSVRLVPGEQRMSPRLRQRALRITTGSQVSNYFLQGKRSLLPDFDQRRERSQKETLQWLHRHRVGQAQFDRPAAGSFSMNAGHAFTSWFNRYGQEHPDYFAMGPNGRREVPVARFAKFCVSNPAVAEQWFANNRAALNRTVPGIAQVVTASPNDGINLGYCLCPGCRAMDDPGAEALELIWRQDSADIDPQMLAVEAFHHSGDTVRMTYHWLSDRYAQFWNSLGRRVREAYPDRELYVGVWAYSAYRKPPVSTRLEENVVVGYVGIGSLTEPITPEAQREQLEEWKGWAANARKMIWRPNLYWRNWGLPYLFMRRAGEHFRELADHRMIGIDVDSLQHDFATQGIQYYVLAQLAWDPYADVEAIVQDYTRRGFGPAAEVVRAYFDLFEEAGVRYTQTHGQAMQHGAAYLFRTVYPRSVMRQAEQLLAEAERLTEGQDRYARRVAFLKTGYTWTWLQLEVARARLAYRDSNTGANERLAAARRIIELSEQRDQLMRASFGQHAIDNLNHLAFFEKQVRPGGDAVANDFAAPDDALLNLVADAP